MKKKEKNISAWSIIAALILSIIFAIASYGIKISENTTLLGVIFVLGIITGFLAISGKNTYNLLLSCFVITIISFVAYELTTLSVFLSNLFGIIATILAPATIILAIKEFFVEK